MKRTVSVDSTHSQGYSSYIVHCMHTAISLVLTCPTHVHIVRFRGEAGDCVILTNVRRSMKLYMGYPEDRQAVYKTTLSRIFTGPVLQ